MVISLLQGSELSDKAKDAAGDAKGSAKDLASKAEDKVCIMFDT